MYAAAGGELGAVTSSGGDCCVTSPDDVTDATTATADSVAILLAVAQGVALALSATGNTLVLYVIGRHLGYRTSTNVFITALCVSDLATAMAGVLVTWSSWSIVDEAKCVSYDVLRRFLMAMSTCMTASLVVDRYMTVVKLRRVQSVTQKTLMTVTGLVTLSFFVSLPWYLLLSALTSTSSKSYWVWPPSCLANFVDAAAIYDVVHLSVTSVLPAAGLAVFAECVLRAVLRSTSAVRPSTSGVGHLLFHDELQIAKTVILLVSAFVACRCVHCVLASLAVWASDGLHGRVLLEGIAALVVTINGIINPIVYAVRNPTVARVLQLRRQQRSGGYVADDTASATSTTVTPATVQTADVGGAVSVYRPGAEHHCHRPDETRVGGCVDKNSCTKMTYVVSGSNDCQQTDVDQPSSSVDFWASRRTSVSITTPSVIFNVTSRRKSSQSSDRTTSTLTSVVI